MKILSITCILALLCMSSLGGQKKANIDLPKESGDTSFIVPFSATNELRKVLELESNKLKLKESPSINRISFLCEEANKIKQGILLFDPNRRDYCVNLILFPKEINDVPFQVPLNDFLIISNSIMEVAVQTGNSISNISNIYIQWSSFQDGKFLSLKSYIDDAGCVNTKVGIK